MEFLYAQKKIEKNKERDKEELKKLAKMGWHCITVCDCELKPDKKEQILSSLAFTLNYIFLQDRSIETGVNRMFG